jgi:hypothetical protein
VKASKVNEAELDAVAKMDMPMMPGMNCSNKMKLK